jgi:hypothetical protein
MFIYIDYSTNLPYIVTSEKSITSSAQTTLSTTVVNQTEECKLLTFQLNSIIIYNYHVFFSRYRSSCIRTSGI